VLWWPRRAQSQVTGVSVEDLMGMAPSYGSGQTLARPAGDEGQGGVRGFQ
jgi:hypothetical protein